MFPREFLTRRNTLQWTVLLLGPIAIVATPVFDPSALFQNILIPADAAVGSIIYRLRASDPTYEYPLTFTLNERSTTLIIENLNCSRLNSICQANVLLNKKLEIDRFYDFFVQVENQRRERVRVNCSFRATDATTPIAEIFPGAPTLLLVSENSRRNTELGVVMAKGNPNRANGVLLELYGSTLFGLHQKLVNKRDAQGTILLLGPLDYEKQTIHHLTVLANDPWTEIAKDTRNIAGWPLIVSVIDEQDTPPIFTLAPPTTPLSSSLSPGDVILRVHAEDGDRGNPREIRYNLLQSQNDSLAFFNISDVTGELVLTRPLKEIMNLHLTQPILVTVLAEEVRSNPEEPPAQSSTVQIALIPPGLKHGSLTFGAKEYSTLLNENSPAGSVLDLPQAEIVAEPGEIIALSLSGDNGTFEISPNVIEDQGKFEIKVRDPKLLDYEKWRSVECFIVARELSFRNLTILAKLTVLLNDLNDNPPEFSEKIYKATIEENAAIGTTVTRVEAHDIDREPGNVVRYIRIKGSKSDCFELNPISGVVTVKKSNDLDAEAADEIYLTIEAADESGNGKVANTTLVITLLDINDETPVFEKNIYEFILNEAMDDFTTEASIKAIDKDISSPNNEIHYGLINENRLVVDEKSGVIAVRNKFNDNSNRVIVVRARAWDGGIPLRSSECDIKIYPPGSQSRTLAFIVNGENPEREEVVKTISALTGAHVRIRDIKPYTGYEDDEDNINISQDDSSERSIVYATLSYNKNTVVDIEKIKQILETNRKIKNQTETKESRGNLLWLLILLIILALLTALILICCCICKGCPLYVPPKRRKIISTSPDMQKLVKGNGYGSENKSVQVAEWFGRKEAWSPEHEASESLQRHEFERGSDRIEAANTKRIHLQQQHQQLLREPSRDQLYIREGNADILRLVTRGGEMNQRPVTLVGDFNDNGKDILMRRFINQQTESQSHNSVQANIGRVLSEHDLIESSLRQQNMLLRQILLERERDLRLETQSLPAGTQTDQNVGTQTDPEFLLPPRRRVRSDNDASDDSDDDYQNSRVLRKTHRKLNHSRRKIKTPIQEESDTEQKVVEKTVSTVTATAKPALQIKQTKTSKLRQMRNVAEQQKTEKPASGIYKEVLREISDSLDQSVSSDDNREKKHRKKRDYYSDDSLEDYTPRTDRQRHHSESDLRAASSLSQMKKSSSQRELKKKSTPRYMEWYNKNQPQKNNERRRRK